MNLEKFVLVCSNDKSLATNIIPKEDDIVKRICRKDDIAENTPIAIA